MSYSCVSCGCSCTTLSITSQCPACCSDGGESNTLVPAGKYASVKDPCNVTRLLENQACAIMVSDGGQVSFKDGSQGDRIPLCSLRELSGMNSILGIQSGDLAQIIPDGSEKLVLQYISGSIRFSKLFIDPCFETSEIVDDGTDSAYALLQEDGSGNYCIKRFRCIIGAGQKKYLYFDENYDAACFDAWDLTGTASASGIYFWNKTTLAVERLGPPTLGGGEAYSDYSLKLNNVTGTPEWVKVTSSALLPAIGRWTFPFQHVSAGTAVTHALSKQADGGSPARFGTGGSITVTSESQLHVVASGFFGAPSGGAGHGGLYWALNGVEIAGTYSQVYSRSGSAAPTSVALWAGTLSVGQQLSLVAKSEGGTLGGSVESRGGSVIVTSL